MTLVEYIERLTVTQGEGAGLPLVLLPWQRRFLDRSSKARVAALSVARGGGKTTLCAAIACAAVDGPLMKPRASCVIVASSFGQARLLFSHVKAFMEPEPAGNIGRGERWKLWDSTGACKIEDQSTGAGVVVIASDPDRAHGLSPGLVLCDEPAKWPRATADLMWSALRTSLGKIPQSRAVCIGTRPRDGGHFFARLLGGEADYRQVHAARPVDDPFSVKSWRKACPSLIGKPCPMPDLLRAIREEAKLAKQEPALLWNFRALRLNMGVSEVGNENLLIDAESWARCECDELPPSTGRYILGLDLSDGAAMCGAAAYWPGSGRLEALAAFPSEPSPAERGLRDGVGKLYSQLVESGELAPRAR